MFGLLVLGCLVGGSLALTCSKTEYSNDCGKEIQIANSYFCNKVYIFGEGNDRREVVYPCEKRLEDSICFCREGFVRYHGECVTEEEAEKRCEAQFGGEPLTTDKIECTGENEVSGGNIDYFFRDLAPYRRDLFCVQPIHRGYEYGRANRMNEKHNYMACYCKEGFVRYQGKCVTSEEANKICHQKVNNRALIAKPETLHCPENEEAKTCGLEKRYRDFKFCMMTPNPIESHYYCQPVPTCLCKENTTRVHGECIADPKKFCDAKLEYGLGCAVAGCGNRLPVSAKCEGGKVIDVVTDECKLDPKNPLNQHIKPCECPFGGKLLEGDEDCKTQRQLELECESRKSRGGDTSSSNKTDHECPRNEKLDVCGSEVHFSNSYFCNNLYNFGYRNERKVIYPCDRPLNDPICFCPQGFVRYHGECVTKEEAEEKCNAQFGEPSECAGENEVPGGSVGYQLEDLSEYSRDVFCVQPVTDNDYGQQRMEDSYRQSKYQNLTCSCKRGFFRYQGKCVTKEDAKKMCSVKLNKIVLIAKPETLQCPENEESKTCGSEMRYGDLGFCYRSPIELYQHQHTFCQPVPECICKENSSRVHGECVSDVERKLCQPFLADTCSVTTCRKLQTTAQCLDGKVVDVVPLEECKFNGTEQARRTFGQMKCECPAGMKKLENDTYCKTQRQLEIECEFKKTGISKLSPLWSI